MRKKAKAKQKYGTKWKANSKSVNCSPETFNEEWTITCNISKQKLPSKCVVCAEDNDQSDTKKNIHQTTRHELWNEERMWEKKTPLAQTNISCACESCVWALNGYHISNGSKRINSIFFRCRDFVDEWTKMQLNTLSMVFLFSCRCFFLSLAVRFGFELHAGYRQSSFWSTFSTFNKMHHSRRFSFRFFSSFARSRF